MLLQTILLRNKTISFIVPCYNKENNKMNYSMMVNN